jgi:Tfp pilus assembly protein PilN
MSTANQLSFLPDDYLERKARRRANILCGVLAVIVLGVIVSAFQYMEKITKAVDAKYAAVDQQYTDAARRIEKVNKMRQQQQQVVRRAELAASLVEKVPRSNILAEFTNSLPPGLSLLNLAMESKERASAAPPAMTAFEQKRAALEGRAANPVVAPKTYDVYLKLEGVAPTDVQVGNFMEKLKRSPLFKDVNLLYTEEFKVQRGREGDGGGQSAKAVEDILRKFQIEMMLNPGAEVVNPANPNSKTSVVEVGAPKQGDAKRAPAVGGTASVGGN